MGSRVRKRTRDGEVSDDAGTSKRSSNYYQPLQALIDDDKTDDTMADSTPKPAKNYIPPITILKTTADEIHKVCKATNVVSYGIRNISIGHKLFCELQYDYDAVRKYLKEHNFESFSHPSKNNRPYKVVLSGLDKMEVNKLKNVLISAGLGVLDVKLVCKKGIYSREVILYIVYLKKGSITMKELREKYYVVDYMRVKWNYQSKRQNKVTQCHNCQMYGHGAEHCNVKTFCSKCSGPHLTSVCTATVVKCANCNGDHTSSDLKCPSRLAYCDLKSRYMKPKSQISQRATFQQTPRAPLNQHSWSNVLFANNPVSQINAHNDLFSTEELMSLTRELIHNLKSCKNKSDQFNVITTLAFKFLP